MPLRVLLFHPLGSCLEVKSIIVSQPAFHRRGSRETLFLGPKTNCDLSQSMHILYNLVQPRTLFSPPTERQSLTRRTPQAWGASIQSSIETKLKNPLLVRGPGR